MSSPPIVQSAPRNHPRCASSPIGAVHHFHSHRDVQGHEPPWLRGRERPCKEKYACCTGIFQRGGHAGVYGGCCSASLTPGYCWPTSFKVLGVLFLGEVYSA